MGELYLLAFAPYLTLGSGLAVSTDAADATACVPGSWWLPGSFSSSTIVVKMPATQVFVGLPVTQDVNRRSGWDRWQAGLADLQLLEVGVDWRVGSALACR